MAAWSVCYLHPFAQAADTLSAAAEVAAAGYLPPALPENMFESEINIK